VISFSVWKENLVLAVTRNGSIVCLRIVQNQDPLIQVQSSMAKHLLSSGSLSHNRFRDIVTPFYSEPYVNYVDLDLISQFASLPSDEQEKLISENNLDINSIQEAQAFLADLSSFIYKSSE
jgi:hypothetical protein